MIRVGAVLLAALALSLVIADLAVRFMEWAS